MIHKIMKMMAAVIVSGCLSVAATPAEASTLEYFKCKLADNVTMDQLNAAASAMLKDAKANGVGDYKLYFLNPLYTSDISKGVFFWVGVSPNALRLGAYNDFWKADANKKHRDRFDALIKDCDSAGAHWLTELKADN
jgi:hypothetical protein